MVRFLQQIGRDFSPERISERKAGVLLFLLFLGNTRNIQDSWEKIYWSLLNRSSVNCRRMISLSLDISFSISDEEGSREMNLINSRRMALEAKSKRCSLSTFRCGMVKDSVFDLRSKMRVPCVPILLVMKTERGFTTNPF
jgi:hypothetical protein